MIETTRFTLPNGLRVVHAYDPPSAMVALNLIYNVGSRDESAHLTGMAHLFEHLMFGGSIHVPDFDAAMERAGGVNNAWTSNDFTNFYDVAPAINAETLFYLESDRMLSLAFSEKSLEVQRSVVIEEFKQTSLNKPYGDLWHHLRRLCYPDGHPYSYPTIGRAIEDIEKVTMEDVRKFFYSHYAPNNAILAITGDITAGEARRLTEKWFSDIPARAITPRTYPAPAPLDGPVRATVTGEVPQPLIAMAFRMGKYGDPDYIPCDLLSDILASGHSSRFYTRLLMGTDLFTNVNASILGSEEPGLFLVTARLRENTDEAITRAEEMLWLQLREVASDGVTDHELLRALNRYESQQTFQSINFLSKAEMLAMAEIHGEDINAMTSIYRSVTTECILNTARKVFRPENSATLIYRPMSV